MTDMERLAAIIEHGESNLVRGALKELLNKGYSPEEIVRDGLMAALERVGRDFETQKIFIPEMLRAARAARLGTEALRSQFVSQHSGKRRKMAIGTVHGDLHDIGKNLVAIAMQTVIEVVDLGVDVPIEEFVRVVEADEDIIFVGISALLTTTLPQMEQTVEALRHSRAADRIKIFVGGAPVSPEFAKRIGADIYTVSAFEAAECAREILCKTNHQGDCDD